MSRSRLVAVATTVLGIVVTTLVVLFAGVFSAAGPAGADTGLVGDTTQASAANPGATVGALFPDGLANGHSCSASVVASPGHDLILTAAHCLSGSVAHWTFVPDYSDGQTPYGTWTVAHAYLPAQWVSDQSPQYDYAILQLAPQTRDGRTVNVQDLVGGNVLGLAPENGQTITDIAYNAGVDDEPVTCTTTVYSTDGYPSFNCAGYVSGSSGSPWLTTVPGTDQDVVRGVIGGLHQGGCYSSTSYSSTFQSDVYKLLVRATFGLHPDDDAPSPGPDGC